MDWIRKTKTEKDLAGTNGKLLSVTPEELAKHASEDDCWIAFRGRVYNMTPYMDFHPGGVDELMRAAGHDGTQLFDEVHQWVNLESMMAACLVGKLVPPLVPQTQTGSKQPELREGNKTIGQVSPKADKNLSPGSLMPPPPTPVFTSLVPPDAVSMRSSSLVTTSSSTPSISVTDGVEHLKTDWYQNDLKLVLVLFAPPNKASHWDSSQRHLSPSNLVVTKDGREFNMEVYRPEGVVVLQWTLFDELAEVDYEMKPKPGGSRIEIILKKKRNIHWISFGKPGPKHLSFKLVPNSDVFWKLHIESITRHNHNTFLLKTAFPSMCFMTPPPGAHVFLRREVKGKKVTRPYTPVHPYFIDRDKQQHDGSRLSFLIKSYDCGEFSQSLGTLKSGDTIEVGVGYFGNLINLGSISTEGKQVCLLAAGTGITPMTSIILELLKPSSSSIKLIHLVFFNRSVDDILFPATLNHLVIQHPKQFKMDHVLSCPNKKWNGYTGHVNKDLLSSLIGIPSSFFFIICGSPEFNVAAETALEAMAIDDSNIHTFS